MKKRNKGSDADYGDFVIYKREDVAPFIASTIDAFQEIKSFLKNKELDI